MKQAGAVDPGAGNGGAGEHKETMATYAIDFETYYSASCTVASGIHNYTSHPEFECFLVSIAGPGAGYCGPPEDAPWDLVGGQGNTWVSHNRAFDMGVMNAMAAKGAAWAACPRPRHWHCSMDLASWSGAPRSLANAAREVLGATVDKSPRDRMKGVRWRDLDETGKEAMRAYALGDARTCLALWDALSPSWPEQERRLSFLTATMGMRGLPVDAGRIDESCGRMRDRVFEARKGVPWAGDEPVLSHKALAGACRKAGIPCPVSLAMDSPECEQWEDRYGDAYPWVAAMRDYRRANILLRRLEAMKARTKPDGFMEYSLKYFGAFTGRWSGGDGGAGGNDGSFNAQNLPRGELLGVNMRSLVRAPEGSMLVVADLGQIEPRVLAVLSGDSRFLELVAGGTDPYEAHARAHMGYDDPRPLRETDPRLRSVAKMRTLLLGYQGGAAKFRSACAASGLDLDADEAARIVREYRASARQVTAMWRRHERDIDGAVGGMLEVPLPSGRKLAYRDVRKDAGNGRTGYSAVTPRYGRLERTKLYGGLVAANRTSATARDILAGHLAEADAAGLDVVLHVHDEIVVMADRKDAHDALRELGRIMTTPPDWMPDIPLAAEGQVTREYVK